MSSKKVLKLVLTAVMAALCFVGTRLIQIPTPNGGYIHLGDGFVFMSGMILGPVYGALAGGIGSMLTDLLSGYAQYAVPTLVIKGIAAFVAGSFSKIALKNVKKAAANFWSISGCVCAGIVVVVGYFGFEAFVMGLGVIPASAGIITNIIQVCFGTVIAMLLAPVFSKITVIKELRFGEVRENKKSNAKCRI